MISVKLNKYEQELSISLAKGRYNNARDNGVTDGKMGDQSNWETDLEGIASEIAFCKAYNYYPDLEIADPSNLPEYDVLSHKGKTIDIKSTKYKNGKLLSVLSKKNHPSDIYVLVTGTFPEYCIVGYATKEQLFIDENIKNLGHGDGYALNQNQLRMLK